MKSNKAWAAVKQLVDNKQIVLVLSEDDDDGIVIGSDKWVYFCNQCSNIIGKNSGMIYKHFMKQHDDIMVMMGLADL